MHALRALSWLLLTLPILGCRGPSLLVNVQNVSSGAGSLSAYVANQNDSGGLVPSVDDLQPYNLTQPVPMPARILLTLPDSLTGNLLVSIGAMQGQGGMGCLLQAGTVTAPYTTDPLDTGVTLGLMDLPAMDMACSGALRLFDAVPSAGSAMGGDLVTLNGWGFKPGADVFFGGNKVSPPPTYVNAGTLMVTTPPAAVGGRVAVQVVNPGGVQVTVDKLYNYAFKNIMLNATTSTLDDQVEDFVVLNTSPTTRTIPYTTNNDFATFVYPIGNPYSDTYMTESSISNLTQLDLNQDGKTDLAVALPMTGAVSVRLNDGMDGFMQKSPNYPAGTSPLAIASGDIDGDGLTDIVTANATGASSSGFAVLLNSKGGLKAPVAYDSTAQIKVPASVGVADMNGDQLQDIVISDKMASNIAIFFNKGAGVFDVQNPAKYIRSPIDSPGVPIVTYDINGDGKLDLILAEESISKIVYALGGSTFSMVSLATMRAPHRIAFGDIDGDGRPDLIVLNNVTGTGNGFIDVYLQPGTGTLFATKPAAMVNLPQLYNMLTPLSGTPEWNRLAVTDIPPEDGKLDIIVSGLATVSNLTPPPATTVQTTLALVHNASQ